MVPFAAPLKAMAAALLEAAGYGPAQIEQILSVGKQKELGLLAGAPTARPAAAVQVPCGVSRHQIPPGSRTGFSQYTLIT